MKYRTLFLLAALWAAATGSAKVALPQMFQKGMVLQRGKAVPVWGVADAGEAVTVTLGKRTVTTTAGADGRWRVDLPPMKAGGPYELRVNDVTLDDVLVGDVWLCSGQSNIDVTVERVYPQYATDIDHYANERIRLLRVQNETDTHAPKSDIGPTRWRHLDKQEAWTFSAVGYFLGRHMYELTGVPQGVIVNSWGGTPIEAWLPADTMQACYPDAYRKTLLYQNDELVATQQRANQLADQRWYEVLNASDPGMAGGWTAADCDDSAWLPASQYELPQAVATLTGRPLPPADYVGSLWLRQHVTIGADRAGQPARLLLGTLYDCDYTFVNGQEVGRTYYQYPPRRYDIPAGVLRQGDNVIAVRFVNKHGVPHFIPEKPYKLVYADGDEQPLSPQWLVRQGVGMPPCPSGDVALQNMPSTLYNAVLHPLAPYALSGVVWYQGESNTGNPAPYQRMLTQLVGSWRSLWGEPQLPFVVVQLANFMQPTEQPRESQWAELREAQRRAVRQLDGTELAVTIDLGEAVDIHPLLKREVAERVGRCLERLAYGRKVLLSPEVVAARREGAAVVLTTDQPLQPGRLYEFELGDADGHFVHAEAEASGTTVRLTAPIAEPVRVRYGWKDNPARANAYAASGLPMAPFQLELPF